MVVALLTMSGLLAVAAMTMVKVKRGMNASSQARFQSVALFAAESGISAGMEFLRSNASPTQFYSDFVSPSNGVIQSPSGIAGNEIAAGELGSLFTAESKMSYTVSILNNPDDPNFSGSLGANTGLDSDGIVVLRAVGRGPGTSKVVLEVEVDGGGGTIGGRPCPGYAQKGIAEDGAGRNDCLTDINGGAMATFTPGS